MAITGLGPSPPSGGTSRHRSGGYSTPHHSHPHTHGAPLVGTLPYSKRKPSYPRPALAFWGPRRTIATTSEVGVLTAIAATSRRRYIPSPQWRQLNPSPLLYP
ncbi:hypothetical protein AVEN_200825-1 [Araneus ventricosus]|uniref:Uncharacterized protein n=1 Tax=Araneus ventricosus TaxID=182803 RepID=A0A4Y2CIM3_ARAVE|nr:hypothetical protein AVEN_200825-1 [Araneus ventricosus]